MPTGPCPPSAGLSRHSPATPARNVDAASGAATTARSPASRLLFAILLSGLSLPSLAHKVVTSAWAEGNAIVGEVGFSNGDMAKAGTKVRIFGPDGVQQAEVVTDADGMFRFVPQQAVAHRFEANLGAGHVGEVVLNEDELPVVMPQHAWPAISDDAAVTPTGETTTPASTTNDDPPQAAPGPVELQAMIALAVQRELRPLRKELSAYKEKNDLQAILGGIGYICGIFGLLFFIAAKRHLREKTPPCTSSTAR